MKDMNEQEFYNHLIRVSERYTILVDALLESAMLGYCKDSLNFDSLKIEPVFKILEYEAYQDKLTALQEDKKRKEAETQPMD